MHVPLSFFLPVDVVVVFLQFASSRTDESTRNGERESERRKQEIVGLVVLLFLLLLLLLPSFSASIIRLQASYPARVRRQLQQQQ